MILQIGQNDKIFLKGKVGKHRWEITVAGMNS